MDAQETISSESRAGLSQTRPTIGLFIGHVFPPNEELLWSGVVAAARYYEVNLMGFCGGFVRHPDPVVAQANVLYELANAQALDGLLICSSAVTWYLTGAELRAFFRRYQPLPCVSLDQVIAGIPSVVKDNYQGMHDALVHLITVHGYRRIAFLQGIEGADWAQARYQAYVDVLRTYRIPLEPTLVAPPPTRWDSSGVPVGGTEQINLLLEERRLRPQHDLEVIVGATDDLARQALAALQSRGLRVPQDMALIGFDDERESRVITPPLTTVQHRMDAMGWKGVEVLLAQLRGEEPPAVTVTPTRLIVRQSCGCQSPLVHQAALAIATMAAESWETGLPTRRAQFIAELSPMFEKLPGRDSERLAAELLDAFVNDLHGTPAGCFLSTLTAIVQQALTAGGDVVAWQDLISTLRRQMRPYLTPVESVRAEDLWGQARILLAEAGQRAQAYQTVQAERRAQTLREIGAKLITTFDVNQLMTILAETLPGLSITSCYLAIYDAWPTSAAAIALGSGPDSARTPAAQAAPVSAALRQAVPEWSHLILAYHEGGRVILEPGGQRFLSHEIVPASFLPQARQYSFVLEPLYFQEHQIGFVLLETGPRAGSVYEALRVELSSALQGDLLVQSVQARTVEIARQKYILDTFMETVPDSIYFKDCAGRITRANQAHANILGVKYALEEVGKTDFDFFPEQVARAKSEQEQDIIRTGQPVVGREELTGLGQWVLTTQMPLRDEHGEIIGTFGIARDITALKQTEQELVRYREHLKELVQERTTELTRSNTRLGEEILERMRVERALRASEEQYRLLAENVKDGIMIVQHGKFVFVNVAFAAMLGELPEQILTLAPLSLFEARTAALAAVRLAAEPLQMPESRWQAAFLTRERRTVWTEIEQTTIVWNSQPAQLLTIRDITERKLREQRLEEERARLEEENLSLKSAIKERYRFGSLVGKSPAMQRVYELIVSAAASGVNVLLSGESGTGKELIARTLWQVSRRKDRAFVPVNCASIPETLFEREFFGHRKGAFTGADRDTSGLFDKAQRGTLFLDEVTELTPGMQAKLLRVLQDGEYTPLGSTTPKQADVVIVAATNKHCQEEIQEKRLRKDFFYRISVIEIRVPPLRERKDDLPLLLEHILTEYHRKQMQRDGQTPSQLLAKQPMLPGELAQVLYTYNWPGNVRELQNVVQRYLATQDGQAILALAGTLGTSRLLADALPVQDNLPLQAAVQTFEKRLIADMLARNRYHIGKTAELLGIPRLTLHRKIKKYQLNTKGKYQK